MILVFEKRSGGAERPHAPSSYLVRAFLASMVLFSEEPIRIIQQFSSPLLDLAFLLITRLGSRTILFALAMFIYWLLDKRAGFFASVVLLSSTVVSDLLKAAFNMPRPSADLQVTPTPGNGFPSGHAQQATVFWTTLARELGGRWVPLALVVIPLVAFSRMYLGVHFLGDVLGGAAFGLVVVAASIRVARIGLWTHLRLRDRLLLAFFVPMVVQGVIFLSTRMVFESLALLTGVALGYILEGRWVAMARPAGPSGFTVRFALGGACLVGFERLDSIVDYGPAEYGLAFLLGLVATLVLPWLFVRIEARVLGRPIPLPQG